MKYRNKKDLKLDNKKDLKFDNKKIRLLEHTTPSGSIIHDDQNNF